MGPGAPTLTSQSRGALPLVSPPGGPPFPPNAPVVVPIDGTQIVGPRSFTDRSWRCSLHRSGRQWVMGELPGGSVRKRHDLQGPIDDAFMDSFVFVKPTGTSPNPAFQRWAAQDPAADVPHWRPAFRGGPPGRARDDGCAVPWHVCGCEPRAFPTSASAFRGARCAAGTSGSTCAAAGARGCSACSYSSGSSGACTLRRREWRRSGHLHGPYGVPDSRDQLLGH